MTKAIRVDAEAEDEIAHAIDRYERERVGLGAEFWDELRTEIRTLEAPGPECGAVIGLPRELGVRRKLLTRFPYAIVFVEGETFVRVSLRDARSLAASVLATTHWMIERRASSSIPCSHFAAQHALPLACA